MNQVQQRIGYRKDTGHKVKITGEREGEYRIYYWAGDEWIGPHWVKKELIEMIYLEIGVIYLPRQDAKK